MITRVKVAGMPQKRRHARVPLTTGLVIQPGDENPARFAGRVFNLSISGAAVYCDYSFAPGKLVEMELFLPIRGVGVRRVVLYGVIRHARALDKGNFLGVEFQQGQRAGDQAWLKQYLSEHIRRKTAPRAFTLTELAITMCILAVLVTMSAPIYVRTMEQARVDAAAGTLKSIWSAQRIYWLEYRTFAGSLSTLETMDLVDHGVAVSASNPSVSFVYQIGSADAQSFRAAAIRNGSGVWVGQLFIDEDGQVSGSITGRGTTLTPPSS